MLWPDHQRPESRHYVLCSMQQFIRIPDRLRQHMKKKKKKE